MSKGLAGLVVVLSWLAAGPAIAAEGREVRRAVALAARGSVSIETFKGSVDVEPWDEPRAEIFARIEPDTTCGDDAAQAERVRLTEIDVDSSASRLKIRSDYDRLQHLPHIRVEFDGGDMTCTAHPFVHYRIRMPRTARLDVQDHKSKIAVAGLRADARIVSHKGSIDVKDHDGALDLTTHKGDARAEFARLGGDSRFETHKGDIAISLPKSAGFDLEAHVGRAGLLDTGFQLAEREWSRRERFYEQKVNGGGPRLELTTKNGAVRLTAR
jgi:hypothetical protein